jgi:hypothetical protein
MYTVILGDCYSRPGGRITNTLTQDSKYNWFDIVATIPVCGGVAVTQTNTPISAEVKKIWIYPSIPPYAFMAQCLNSYAQGQFSTCFRPYRPYPGTCRNTEPVTDYVAQMLVWNFCWLMRVGSYFNLCVLNCNLKLNIHITILPVLKTNKIKPNH